MLPHAQRVSIELALGEPYFLQGDPIRLAEQVNDALDHAGSTCPRLAHGEKDWTWPLVKDGFRRGHDTRVGYEDCLLLPDGTQAGRSPAPAPSGWWKQSGDLDQELAFEHAANRCYEDYRSGGKMKDGRRFGGPPLPYEPPLVPDGKVNTTDHDSRIMRTQGQPAIQGYNAQAAVTEQQIIVAAEVTIDSPDFGHLEPMVAAVRLDLDRAGVTEQPRTVLADTGYWHKKQIENVGGRFERALAVADGLVITGAAEDLHPGLYSGQLKDGVRGNPAHTRDRGDLAVLGAAIALDLPIVGICRGHQLLNIASGGTLYQDLVADGATRRSHEGDHHEVNTVRGTTVRRVVGQASRVRSEHHQAIRRLGRRLTVAATSPDGVIEAIERSDRRFVLGLQWHPETATDSRGKLVAEALIEAARRPAA